MKPPQPQELAQGLLLAAGRGERMRPLSDHLPKPLLALKGRSLIERLLDQMQHSGMQSVVINSAWLGSTLRSHLGTVHQCACHAHNLSGLHMLHSCEDLDFGAALETGGGIVRALPLLSDVFWVAAADVHVPEFEFSAQHLQSLANSPYLAHLWLVPNPAHHPKGDFCLDGHEARVPHAADASNPALAHPSYTFSTIAIYKKAFFESPWCQIESGNPHGTPHALAPWLKAAMAQGKVCASLYKGHWTDVGTPERLDELNR